MRSVIPRHWSRIGGNEFSHNDIGKPLFLATRCKKNDDLRSVKKGRMENHVGRLVNLNVVLISWIPSIRQTDLLWKTLIGRGLYTGRRPGMP